MKEKYLSVSYTHLDVYKRQQQKKVESVGGVVDARSGESVVGATVRVKDVNSGVITDMDGKFTICLLYTSRCV